MIMTNKKKILIINDDSDMVRQMKRWLIAAEFYVQSTLTGKEGVTLIKQENFDLILLDFYLKKETDGAKTATDFVPQIKRHKPLIPIIVTSATELNLSAQNLGVSKTLSINSSFWKSFTNSVKEVLRGE